MEKQFFIRQNQSPFGDRAELHAGSECFRGKQERGRLGFGGRLSQGGARSSLALGFCLTLRIVARSSLWKRMMRGASALFRGDPWEKAGILGTREVVEWTIFLDSRGRMNEDSRS